MRILNILILILLIFPVIAYSGNSGASFLKISPGARPVGMGGAYTAVSGDINSLYYNPAGIACIDTPQLGAMHTQWITDIKYNFVAGAYNLKNKVIGVSATLLTMGEIEGRGENREEIESFSAYDLAVQFSYARNLNNNYLLGGSLKFIKQKIADESANGIAIDLGVQKQISNIFNTGIALRNLGPQMSFITEGYNLPLTLSVGSGITIGGINIGLDTNYEIIDKKLKVSFGTEYVPLQFLSLRGGYFFNLLNEITGLSDNDISEPKDGFGGGIGIKVMKYSFDYAVVPYVDFGTTQRISLTAKF